MIHIKERHKKDFKVEGYVLYKEIIQLIFENMPNKPYIMYKGGQVYEFQNKKGETKYLRVYVDYNDLNGFIENAFIMNRNPEILEVEDLFRSYFN